MHEKILNTHEKVALGLVLDTYKSVFQKASKKTGEMYRRTFEHVNMILSYFQMILFYQFFNCKNEQNY